MRKVMTFAVLERQNKKAPGEMESLGALDQNRRAKRLTSLPV